MPCKKNKTQTGLDRCIGCDNMFPVDRFVSAVVPCFHQKDTITFGISVLCTHCEGRSVSYQNDDHIEGGLE